MRPGALLTCLLLGAAALTGCFFDPTVPEDAQLSCLDDGDCPDGYICQQSIELCVRSSAVDTSPPGLTGETALEPTTGTIGQTFTLRFTVSEPLFAPPIVTLDAGDRDAPFAMDEAASDAAGLAYVYTYTVDGSEAQGPREVKLYLVDQGGAEAWPSAGIVTLDFAAPRVTASAIDKEHAMAGATARLSISLSEAADGEPDVVMSAGGASLAWTHQTASADGLEHSFTYTASGSELEALYQVRASARDAAGNQGAPEEVARLALDFTAPTLTDQLVAPGALVRPGAILSVALEVDEPLPGAPALVGLPLAASGTSIAFAAEQPGESSLLYTHTVRAGEDGDYQLSLDSLIDDAGNATPAQVLATVRLDGAAPQIVNFTQSATSLNASGSLEVSFESSEPLAGPPLVEIEGHLFTRQDSDAAPYRYTLDMAGTDLLGSYSISVGMVDEALNAATYRPGVITVDSRPPRVIDAIFTPAAARLGVTVLLTITVDEPLLEPAGAPALVLSWAMPAGDPGFQFLVRSGLSYTYALMIDDTVAGPSYGVESVDLIDEADNPASVDLSTVPSAPVTLTVDNQPPLLSGVATDRAVYSAQAGFNSITLTLDVDEDLDVAPGSLAASIGSVPFVCGAYQASSPRYTCTRPVDDGVDAHGGALIHILATDAAGNQTFDSTSVELDFVAPSVVAGSENVQLIPANGALLTTVSKVTLGTTVRVFFAADEPLAIDPIVFSMPDPRTEFVRTGGAGTFYVYEHTLVDPAVGDGERDVGATLRDLVGNRATLSLTLPAPGFEVDQSPPAPLSQAQDDLLRYVRVPWGASSSAGGPVFRVEQLQPGGLPAGATVIFWDRAAIPTALELGRGLVDAGGTLATVALNRSDRALIYASLVDEAGNIDSASASLLHQTEWIATLGGKVRGSVEENPHRAETRAWLDRLAQRIDSGTGTAEARPEPLQLPDLDPLSVGAAEVRWRKLQTADPPASEHNQMAYDVARGVTVLFMVDSGETWERRDRAWRQVPTRDPEGDGEPAAGAEYAIAYDQRLALVTLINTSSAGAPVWQWTGVSWRLVAIDDPEGDGAPTRSRWACAGWDGVNREVLLYGGETTFSHNVNLWSSSDELWSFDGASWKRITPTPATPRPQAAYGCAMTWDPDRRRVVWLRSGTWDWDGAGWEQRTSGAPIAVNTRLVYDHLRQRVVAHGGSNGIGTLQDNTFEYDPQTGTWATVYVSDWACTTDPCLRRGHGMVFDQGLGRTVLFGGKRRNDVINNDTLEWDGTSWSMQPLSDPEGDGEPAISFYVSFGYDQDRGRAQLLNWLQPSGYVADWWQHDGASWSVPTIEDTLGDGDPGWRWAGALVYDDHPGRQHFLFFGGYGECPGVGQCGDTWTFDGSEWEKRCDSVASGGPCDAGDGLPGARGWYPGAAFDSLRKETYLYGGSAAAEGQQLWRWDGAQWHLEAPATATLPTSGIEAPSMTYDEDRDLIVMFGGWEGTSPTTPHVWEWSIADSEWSEIVPTDPEGDGSPVQSYQTALYFDRARHVVVLHEDRFDLSPQQVHSWEWDGQSWRRLITASPVTGELPSVSHSWMSLLSVHDLSAGRTFLLADDLWELLRGAEVQPALTLHFDLAAANAPPGTALQEITLDAIAGARSQVSGVATDSVAIASWSDLGWQQRVTAAIGPGAPGPISWSTDVAAELDTLLVDDVLHLAILPEGVNGDASAEVAVDYVELRVLYRLP